VIVIGLAGDEAFRAGRPFPVTVAPSELMPARARQPPGSR